MKRHDHLLSFFLVVAVALCGTAVAESLEWKRHVPPPAVKALVAVQSEIENANAGLAKSRMAWLADLDTAAFRGPNALRDLAVAWTLGSYRTAQVTAPVSTFRDARSKAVSRLTKLLTPILPSMPKLAFVQFSADLMKEAKDFASLLPSLLVCIEKARAEPAMRVRLCAALISRDLDAICAVFLQSDAALPGRLASDADLKSAIQQLAREKALCDCARDALGPLVAPAVPCTDADRKAVAAFVAAAANVPEGVRTRVTFVGTEGVDAVSVACMYLGALRDSFRSAAVRELGVSYADLLDLRNPIGTVNQQPYVSPYLPQSISESEMLLFSDHPDADAAAMLIANDPRGMYATFSSEDVPQLRELVLVRMQAFVAAIAENLPKALTRTGAVSTVKAFFKGNDYSIRGELRILSGHPVPFMVIVVSDGVATAELGELLSYEKAVMCLNEASAAIKKTGWRTRIEALVAGTTALEVPENTAGSDFLAFADIALRNDARLRSVLRVAGVPSGAVLNEPYAATISAMRGIVQGIVVDAKRFVEITSIFGSVHGDELSAFQRRAMTSIGFARASIKDATGEKVVAP